MPLEHREPPSTARELLDEQPRSDLCLPLVQANVNLQCCPGRLLSGEADPVASAEVEEPHTNQSDRSMDPHGPILATSGASLKGG